MTEMRGTTNKNAKWLCYGRKHPWEKGIVLTVLRRRPLPKSIRFDHETLEALLFVSAVEERSVSSIVISAVRQYLRGKGRLDG